MVCMRYSVVTFVFGDYELLREPLETSSDCEYIAVTDNHNLTSKTWRIKYLPDCMNEADSITKTMYVRYHPFEFATSNTCVVIDGSILLKKSLDFVVSKFNQSGANCALMLHWLHNNARKEYYEWVEQRSYSTQQCMKCQAFMDAVGYTTDIKGAFEAGFKIQRNDVINNRLNTVVYKSLEFIGGGALHVERLDQGILTAIAHTKFPTLKVFPVTHQIIQSQYMQYFQHKTNNPITVRVRPDCSYMFNKKVDVFVP